MGEGAFPSSPEPPWAASPDMGGEGGVQRPGWAGGEAQTGLLRADRLPRKAPERPSPARQATYTSSESWLTGSNRGKMGQRLRATHPALEGQGWRSERRERGQKAESTKTFTVCSKQHAAAVLEQGVVQWG